MRHEFAAGPVASGSGRVSESSTAGALIATSGLSYVVAPCVGSAVTAVSIAAIATAADEDLRPAASAQIQAARGLQHWRFLRTPKMRSRPRSTGRASNAILAAHTALRPAGGPAIWIPCGGAAPNWTWRLRPVPHLLFFFGKRLSTMRPAQCDAGRASSRPTGSLRRARINHLLASHQPHSQFLFLCVRCAAAL